jgi:antitoxin HicB
VNEVAIRLHVEPSEDGGFVATSPDVQGLVAEGRTVAECARLAADLARAIAESCIAHGDPLPEVFRRGPQDGQFELTVPVQVA